MNVPPILTSLGVLLLATSCDVTPPDARNLAARGEFRKLERYVHQGRLSAWEAADALCVTRDPAALEPLQRLIGRIDNPVLRAHSATALATLKRTDARSILDALTADPDELVAGCACMALVELGLATPEQSRRAAQEMTGWGPRIIDC